MTDATKPLEDVLDDFARTVDEDGTSVGALIHAFEDRSLGAVLVVFAGLLLTPLGGIPGAPDVVAAVILVFVVQSWFGKKGIWVPGFVAKREIDEEKLDATVKKARPWAQRVDGLLKTRLSFLVDSRAARIAISVICAALTPAIFILGFVPFAMLPAAAAIFAFGLALLGRDGLLALVGYLFVGGTAYALYYFWGSVFG